MLVVSPAAAAGEVTVSIPSGVLYESCGQYPFTYAAGGLPAGYGPYWNMDFNLIGPDGREAGGDYLYGELANGVSDIQICESPNLPGTYTLTGTGEACNRSYDCVPISMTPTSFTLRLPLTKTTLKASTTNPRPSQVVRFVIGSRDERPNGYYGTAYADVALQVKTATGWRKVGGNQMTDSRGREVIEARYTGGRKRLRAVTFSSDSRTGSVSRTVVLR